MVHENFRIDYVGWVVAELAADLNIEAAFRPRHATNTSMAPRQSPESASVRSFTIDAATPEIFDKYQGR